MLGFRPLVVPRMGLRPFDRSQNVGWDRMGFGQMCADRLIAVLVGGVRELDAGAVGCVPLGGSLGDDTTDAGLLGGDLVAGSVAVLVGTVWVHLL